ncbi:hypothetical protein [Archangium sp.]|uniref:hypothetical protein n=1 Tax=Archangium sp. TaxID=1872627 RepID=UPI002EDB7E98
MAPLPLLVLVLALWACHPEALRPPQLPEASNALRYHVTYVREPAPALDVEITRTREDSPLDFLFSQPGGVSRVLAVESEGPVHALTVSAEGRVIAPSGTRFLRYRYLLDANPRRGRRGLSASAGMGEGDAWHVAGRAWLLRPRTVTPSMRATLRVEGVDALLPWAPDPEGVYHLRGEDLVDSGLHGFGGRRCTARPPGAVLEVALLGRFSRMDDAALCEWLRQSAEVVLTVRRSFPYPRITVRLVSVPGRESSALFGTVQWSSPPSVSLFVGQDSAPESFQEDWVVLHEFLHLAHPPVLPRVPWLTEGLATYYTEVGRARAGRFSPEQAWTELLAGFARGRSAVAGRTMRDVVDSGDSYMGTYWTGALFALHLDVELRRATGNRHGLDEVLERLAASGPTATFDGFGAAVDAVAGRPLFGSLLARHLDAPAFAEQGALLQALGVEGGPDGVRLGAARDSPLREALEGR